MRQHKVVQVAGVIWLALALVLLQGCSSSEDRAQNYFQRGSEYADRGDLVKATLEFRNALRLKPGLVDAHFAMAQALEQQGDYAAAAKSYFNVTELAADNVPARVRLGYILLAAGQVDEASKYAEQASAISPSDPSVLVVRASIALKRGDASTSVDLANAALKQQPGLTDAYAVLASERLIAADPAGALSYLDKVSGTADRDLGVQLLRLSALEAAGDDAGVEALLKRMIELSPRAPQLREALVRWYLEKGRTDDAEASMRAFVAGSGEDDTAALSLVAFLKSERGADIAAAELQSMIDARGDGRDAFLLKQALAQLRFDQGEQAAALSMTRALVDATGDAKEKNSARLQLAVMLATQNERTEAASLAEVVLGEDARNVDALALLGALRMADGQISEAIQHLIGAVNEAPENVRVHSLLADAYERSGSTVLAEEQFLRAAELDKYGPETGVPMARFFLRYGKLDRALRVLEAVRRQAPDNREALAMLADLKLTNQDWAGAQEIADTLGRLNSGSDAGADRIRAAALAGLSRYSESIELLQAALLKDQGGAQLLPDLIAAYMRSGKSEVAEAYLKDLLAKDPADSKALVLLGSVRMAQGKSEAAEEEFKQAAAVEGDIEGDIALAQFYWSAGKMKEAEDVVARALEQRPDSIALQRMSAALFERSGRFEEAIAQHEKLLALDPSSASAANDLASLLSERRSDAESLDRAFKIAQRLSGSEIPQYLDTLGWIYHLRGDQASALPLLKTAAQRLPELGLVQYHLGVVLGELGQKEAAEASLNKALVAKSGLFGVDRTRAEEALRALTTEPAATQPKTSS